MAKAEPIMKGITRVATKIGKMIVDGKGGKGKEGYIGRITPPKSAKPKSK